MSYCTDRSERTRTWRRLTVTTCSVAAVVAAVVFPAAATVAPLAAQHAQHAATARTWEYPAAQWQPVASPESVGWSSEGLAHVRAHLEELSTSGMMVVVGGRVLFAYGDTEVQSYLASVRKSVLSMLYGIYVHEGRVDLDRTLEQLGIDDIEGLTQAEKQATIRHLLQARSGVYHPASNAGDDLASAPARGSQRPGEYYLYSNWDFNALGTIFEQEAGIGIYDAVDRHLAGPLGMQDWDRARQRKTGNLAQSRHPAYHMHFSTRDMARIGYLMLREGEWNGAQVIPRAWVHESVTPHTRRMEMNPERRREGPWGYGYLWWIFDDPSLPSEFEGGYAGLGAVGQYILVLPKLDLVIAHKTVPGDDRSVTGPQFMDTVRLLVAARCRDGVCVHQ
jgi:CubicO group peptidase (beta-lactamase class C family)